MKKNQQPGAAQTAEADISVLMIGPRRAGKSSVLSAMLKSMERLEKDTQVVFEADDDTKQVMRERLSDLEKLFVLHASKPDVPFSTIMGAEGGQVYSQITAAALFYRFVFYLKSAKKKKHIVEFTDIPGEQMVSDLSGPGMSVTDRFIKSNVVVIAVDSPALMEGKIKKGVGEFHTIVNIPASIREVIAAGDSRMRAENTRNYPLRPKLILIVPLKCEKYYHEGRMEELQERVKEGYKSVLSYLEGRKEYTVAITPILTLGDIVFDHYAVSMTPKGVEKVKILKGDNEAGISNMPEPLYRIRKTGNPHFSPRFCVQPLIYIANYIVSLGKMKEKLKEEADNEKKLKKNIKRFAKIMLFILYPQAYILWFGGSKLLDMLNSKEMMKSVQTLAQEIKTEGDGYGIVQDNMGLSKEMK